MPYKVGESGFDNGPDDMPNDEPSFAIGMCRGVRSFGLAPDGTLTGVNYRQAWSDGQNRALCYVGYPPLYIPEAVTTIEQINSTLRYTPPNMGKETMPERPVDISEDRHRLKGCTCGFWSYWGLANSYMRSVRVAGIIEGYGRVVIGKRGFRCSLANIRAIYVPLGDVELPDNVLDAMAKIHTKYPSAEIFDNYEQMLFWYPPDKIVQ